VDAQFSETFEAYPVGPIGNQSPSLWNTYFGDYDVTTSLTINSAVTFNGSRSGLINQNRDAILNLGNKSSGKWSLTFKMYVPTNKSAYFNLQSTLDANGGSGQMASSFINDGFNFNQNNASPGIGNVAGTGVTFNFPHDTWFTVEIYFNVDNKSHQLKVNNTIVNTIVTPFNNDNTVLGGVDFFGGSPESQYYLDDMTFVEVFNPDSDLVTDLNFEQALIDLNIDTNGLTGDVLNSDVLATTSINANNRNISDLRGLEAFSNLTFLNLQNNNITDIDVSNNLNLIDFRVSNNPLASGVDISILGNLENFYADGININSLNVTNNLNLKFLIARNNLLTTIDLTNNPNLTVLFLGNNDISTIDLSNNLLLERISLYQNRITSFDATIFPNLTLLDLQDTDAGFDLTSVDVSGLTALDILFVGENSNLTTLDISTNTALRRIGINDTGISAINISNALLLEDFYAGIAQLSGAIDFSGFPNLKTVDLFQNDFTDVNVANGNNSNLINLYTGDNPNLNCITVDDINLAYANEANNTWLKSPYQNYQIDCSIAPGSIFVPDNNLEQALIDQGIDQSGVLDDFILVTEALGTYFLDLNSLNITDPTGLEEFVNLRGLNISNNNLSVINVSTMNEIDYLDVSSNNLNTLNINNNLLLKVLYVANNNLTGINIGPLNLREFGCDNNSIVSLNLTNSTDLERLYATNNALNGLDITSNINLQYAFVNENPNIGQLDLTNQTQLIEFGASNIGDSTFDLSSNPNLEILQLPNNLITGINLSNNLLLRELDLNNNDIFGSFDFSNHNALEIVLFEGNNLNQLNLKNGNTNAIIDYDTRNNPNLTCIEVDDVAFATTNFTLRDAAQNFSTNCFYPDLIAIPDANFEQALISLSFDTNGLSGNILRTEAEALTALNVGNSNISSLTGIEGFINLTDLRFANNNISNVDLANLSQLQLISCSGNQLTSLDFSNNPNFTQLYGDNNLINTVTFNNESIVTNFNLRNNPINILDLAGFNNLTQIDVAFSDITNLNFANNILVEDIFIDGLNLNVLNLNNNTNLIALNASDLVNLNTFNLPNSAPNFLLLRANNSGIPNFNIGTYASLELVELADNNLTDLDASLNTNLITFRARNNSLLNLNLNNTNNTGLINLDIRDNTNLTCVQVDDVTQANSNVTNGTWFKDVGTTFSTNCSLSVVDNVFEDNLVIYPNPFSNKIHIKTTELIKSISVSDINGKMVFNSIQGLNTINLEQLNNGLYFITIQFENTQVIKKLIKN
tara:strand:- start:2850 stop:6635 length:3786 start_codon:yes stop_codon:yes gene_type:complete